MMRRSSRSPSQEVGVGLLLVPTEDVHAIYKCIYEHARHDGDPAGLSRGTGARWVRHAAGPSSFHCTGHPNDRAERENARARERKKGHPQPEVPLSRSSALYLMTYS